MSDYTKIQMTSEASANKVLLSSVGTLNIPLLPGVGANAGTLTVPHGYGSDNLLFQVSVNDPATTNGLTRLPWSTGDGRISLYASVDAQNLYVHGWHSDAGGGGDPARSLSVYYRVLIP